MKWYWVLLIIYGYIAIGAIFSALVLGTTDDDSFPVIAIFWPIALVIAILAIPVKLILDIL